MTSEFGPLTQTEEDVASFNVREKNTNNATENS